jgi:deoxyribodipyrimidine photo-lyase
VRLTARASARYAQVLAHKRWQHRAMAYRRALVWMRRDLRLGDNTALHAAAQESESIACAFVLDATLLRGERVGAPIVQFFFDSLAELRERLRGAGSDLALLEGDFATELIAYAKRIGADAVFYNSDTEPTAVARDRRTETAFKNAGLAVHASSIRCISKRMP